MYDTSKFKLTFPLSNGVSFELKDPLFRSENLFKQGNFFVKHPVDRELTGSVTEITYLWENT